MKWSVRLCALVLLGTQINASPNPPHNLQPILNAVLNNPAVEYFINLEPLNQNAPLPVKFHYNITQFASILHDYTMEEYYVTTEDGYNLALHRLKGREGRQTDDLPEFPVLFSHGIFTNGFDWTISDKPKSLGFELADNGTDVWFVSHRGTDYSNTNIYMTEDDFDFYNYSFHEMGVYDLPACIRFIKAVTGALKVIHVGFSQGGASAMVCFAELPEFWDANVHMHISLSSAARICHGTTPLVALFTFMEGFNFLMQYFFNTIGHINFVSLFQPILLPLAYICYNTREIGLCAIILGYFFDYNLYFLSDPEFVSLLAYKYLKVTSSKQIFHFIQNSYNCEFAKYKEYPTDEWEYYDVTHAVSTKMYAFHSVDDHFVPEQNIYDMKNAMTGTVLNVYIVPKYFHINMCFDEEEFANLRQDVLGLIYAENSIVPLTAP